MNPLVFLPLALSVHGGPPLPDLFPAREDGPPLLRPSRQAAAAAKRERRRERRLRLRDKQRGYAIFDVALCGELVRWVRSQSGERPNYFDAATTVVDTLLADLRWTPERIGYDPDAAVRAWAGAR